MKFISSAIELNVTHAWREQDELPTPLYERSEIQGTLYFSRGTQAELETRLTDAEQAELEALLGRIAERVEREVAIEAQVRASVEPLDAVR